MKRDASSINKPLAAAVIKFLTTIEEVENYLECRQLTVITGYNNIAVGEENLIAGSENKVKGSQNVVLGDKNLLAGDEGLMKGSGNSVIGNDTMVIGNNNTAMGNNTYVFSFDNKVNKNNSLVIGTYEVDLNKYKGK